jgi:hypothetical protein
MRSQMLELNEATSSRMLEFHESSTAQIHSLSRVTGRLEGAIHGLDASVAELRADVRRLGERVAALER